jgi:acyl-CoA thioester hydrolase
VAASPVTPVIWSARVRYAEVDQQGVVFNSHYLLYCDEAMAAFCRHHRLDQLVTDVQLVASTIQWVAPARYNDTVDVEVGCSRVGRTSMALTFDIRVAGRECCRVETTYVNTDLAGTPVPFTDEQRAVLLG